MKTTFASHRPGLAVLVLLAACGTRATGRPSSNRSGASAPLLAGEAFRGERPGAGAPRPLRTPAFQQFTLDNGLAVLLVERRTVPIVTLTMLFEGGSAADPEGREGMAATCGGLLAEGTAALDKVALSELLADAASHLGSEASADQVIVSMDTLRESFDETVALWADVIVHPALRPDELERAIKRRLAGLRQIKSNPASIATRLIPSIVYGPRHPLGRLATERSLRALTIDDCRTFHARYIRPQGARLIVVGAISGDELKKALTARLAGWTGGSKVSLPTSDVRPRPGGVFLVDMPKASQSVLDLLDLGPERRAADFPATSLMSGILGGDFSSRINMNIRQRHGYAYTARGGFQYDRAGSIFRAGASVRTDVTRAAIVEIVGEIDRLRLSGPTEEELAREKQSRVFTLPTRFATGLQTMNAFREMVYFGLPLDYFDTLAARLTEVDLTALRDAAARHLRPRSLQVLVVGDSKAVRAQLEHLSTEAGLERGGLVLLDADGESVGAGR